MMRLCLLMLIAIFSAPFIAPLITNAQNGNKQRPVEQVYRRYCVSCHGSDGRAQGSKGKYSHARDLTDAKWQDEVTDERIFNSIMNGRNVRGNMPAFSNKIHQQEVEALVNFVRRFKG